MSCAHCNLSKRTKKYPDATSTMYAGEYIGETDLCDVCANLYGVNTGLEPTLTQINRNIALLFHALKAKPPKG
jgi:hypothetical protein